MNAAASAVCGCEKSFDRRALDDAPLVQVDHFVAQAPRLAEVVRGHHDLGARGVEGADDGLDLAGGTRIEARGGLVEENLRVQRPGARKRKALLLAAREHACRAGATWARPTSSTASIACFSASFTPTSFSA